MDLLNEYNAQQNELRENYIVSLNKRSQSQQSTWLKKLHALTIKLDDDSLSLPQRIRLKLEIDEAEEQISISSLMLKLVKYHDHMEDINARLAHMVTVQSIDRELHSLNNLRNDFGYVDKKIETKFEIMGKRSEIQKNYYQEGILTEAQYKANTNLLRDLKTQFNKVKGTIKNHLNRLSQLTQLANHKMAEAISRRQSLPGANLLEWQRLSTSLLKIPSQSLDLISNLYKHVMLNY